MSHFHTAETVLPARTDATQLRGTGRAVRAAAASLVTVHVLLLAWGAVVHSPTLTEPAHLVAGISNWRFGRFDIFCVNPPLVRMTAAAPVVAVGARTDWRRFVEAPGARPEFALGEDFVAANGERSLWLFTLARWACIPFSVAGGYVCFRWARDLYGAAAGLLSLALWCFCPNILGHGQLITPDVAATSLGLAACYAFWHWLRSPAWGRALASGLLLGLALLTKFTLVVFVLLWPLLWLAYRWPAWRVATRVDPARKGRRSLGREAAMLAALYVASLYVVNLGYGFVGTGTRLEDFRFVSAALGAAPRADEAPPGGGNRFRDRWIAGLPVPLPKQYLLGIDLQKYDFETEFRPSYLRGELRQQGWWYYYLYALAIKVPLGTWLLLALTLALRLVFAWRAPSRSDDPWSDPEAVSWRDELVLLAPAAIILTLVSAETSFSRHMRYVLPMFPFVFVWIGQVAGLAQRPNNLTRHVATGLATAALAWSVVGSLWVYPHSLSYFNELVGGPKGGPAHLIDSNVDWGQDLLKLKSWLAEHPDARPLNLLYFGYVDPRDLGIEFTVPNESLLSPGERPAPAGDFPPGWYAVSVTFVRGFPYRVYDGAGGKSPVAAHALTSFQHRAPVARAGYSINIYYLHGD